MIARTTITPRVSRRRLRLRVTTNHGSLFTVNVSPGGVCTELMHVLPVGAHLDGVVHLEGRDAPFAGRVAWAVTGDIRFNQLGRMGVRFERIDPQFARGLAVREGGPTLGGDRIGGTQ
jgi:hypothetical protein